MTVDEILEAQEEMYQYFQYVAWKEVQERRAIEDELFAKEFDLIQEMRSGV